MVFLDLFVGLDDLSVPGLKDGDGGFLKNGFHLGLGVSGYLDFAVSLGSCLIESLMIARSCNRFPNAYLFLRVDERGLGTSEGTYMGEFSASPK